MRKTAQGETPAWQSDTVLSCRGATPSHSCDGSRGLHRPARRTGPGRPGRRRGAPPPPVPLDQAALNAGNGVLAATVAAGGRTVVIDPLVNGVTGEQSASTKTLGTRLADLARERYPQLEVKPFDSATVAQAPIVLIGTFTPVNASNQPAGPREAYRFCLVAADLRTGKIVAKRVVRAQTAGVDGTPTRMFADSPAWTDDASVRAYIQTCQGRRSATRSRRLT